MALIVDAGPIIAQIDAGEPRHREVTKILLTDSELLVTTELVIAEVDYLILKRFGVDVELAFLRDLSEGVYRVECLSREEIGRARSLVGRYRDLRLGLADASLVVLADRYHTNRLLTFDTRAFRTVPPLDGGTFTILPSDRESGRGS